MSPQVEFSVSGTVSTKDKERPRWHSPFWWMHDLHCLSTSSFTLSRTAIE